MAVTAMSLCSRAARSTRRPMRPKPLMPTRVTPVGVWAIVRGELGGDGGLRADRPRHTTESHSRALPSTRTEKYRYDVTLSSALRFPSFRGGGRARPHGAERAAQAVGAPRLVAVELGIRRNCVRTDECCADLTLVARTEQLPYTPAMMALRLSRLAAAMALVLCDLRWMQSQLDLPSRLRHPRGPRKQWSKRARRYCCSLRFPRPPSRRSP